MTSYLKVNFSKSNIFIKRTIYLFYNLAKNRFDFLPTCLMLGLGHDFYATMRSRFVK